MVGPLRYTRVVRNAPKRFWWLWTLATIVAMIAAPFAQGLRVDVGAYWIDFRAFLVSAVTLGYAIYFFRSRPHTVSDRAEIRNGSLVSTSSGRPIVGRRAGSLLALSICNDPRAPSRLLAAGNLENGDEFILGAPADLLPQLRQMLDVPSSGTGWITFGVTPTFPFAATFQWFASLALCISTIIALSTEHPPRDIELILALVPTQCFAIVTFASIFFRTNPQPFLALGVGGIRAFLATNDASGWRREVRILPWASVVQTEHRADRVDLVEARNGGYVRASLGLPRLAAATSAVIQGQIQDAVRRAHGAAPAATENEVLGRLAPYPDEPPEAWRARLELAATTGGYRGGDRDVGAWSDALVDPDAPPNVRVAAGFLLTRVAPERTAEITHLLEDLRDDEARVLARTLLDGLSGKTCG